MSYLENSHTWVTAEYPFRRTFKYQLHLKARYQLFTEGQENKNLKLSSKYFQEFSLLFK